MAKPSQQRVYEGASSAVATGGHCDIGSSALEQQSEGSPVAVRTVESRSLSTIGRSDPTSPDLRTLRADLVMIFERLKAVENLLAIVPLLLAQVADPTHVTIASAARLVGCSVKSIRRRIANGSLPYEMIPSTRRRGIPVSSLYAGWWIPVSVAKDLIEQERREIAKLKGKS